MLYVKSQIMNEFEKNNLELLSLLDKWEKKLHELPAAIIVDRRNRQNRNIKQILGHMIDSASNNTHRTVHLQYQESPLRFPNYASHGNNDRWIAIQNYQEESWENMVKLWKYSNLHFIHVIRNVDLTKLDNVWQADTEKYISLREGITDYLRHFKLHLGEIDELIRS